MTTLSLNDFNNFAQHPESKSSVIEYKARALGIYEEYSDFISRINDEIDSIIIKIEDARNYYNAQSEDGITYIICMMLSQKSINVSHGGYASGETDLKIVQGPNTYIVESKWWSQTESALEGMRQLSTRYSTGGNRASSGAILLYNKTSNLTEKLNNLKETYGMLGDEFTNIRTSECEQSDLAFKTTHQHISSGTDYEVRHRAINLHHQPTDRSARNRRPNALVDGDEP